VGSHGDGHERATALGAAATSADIARSWNSIAEATGSRPRYYRPPHGILTPAAWRAAVSHGMRPTLWSGSAGDWRVDTTPERVAAAVVGAARPGAIVLLHDAGGSPGRARVTVDALPAILEGLAGRGLQPVTLSTLTRVSEATAVAR
jgi:peptidoglycan/xylan/chitin deacetylase (PgdA/CDA1 family)